MTSSFFVNSFTFLATLLLLLAVSCAIVIRSLILRRRFRRRVQEALANGVVLPPPPGGFAGAMGFGGRVRRDFGEKPTMWDRWLAPPHEQDFALGDEKNGGKGVGKKWNDIMVSFPSHPGSFSLSPERMFLKEAILSGPGQFPVDVVRMFYSLWELVLFENSDDCDDWRVVRVFLCLTPHKDNFPSLVGTRSIVVASGLHCGSWIASGVQLRPSTFSNYIHALY